MGFSTKRFCTHLLRWIPCVFIILIVLWSYYAYVVALCIFVVPNVLQKVLYLLFYHLFFFIFVWTYYQIIFAPIGTPSEEYQIPPSLVQQLESTLHEEERKVLINDFAKNLPLKLRTAEGGIRYCRITHTIKPDRCHYCSVVGKCVLKMDHYCPWVNNCVGFSNYKFFVLFLFYGFLYCLYVGATSAPFFVKFWSGNGFRSQSNNFQVLFLFFVAVMFAISLSFLLGYHIYLVLKNQTTIEAMRAPFFRDGPDKNGFNVGAKKNFEQVFGEDKKVWFIPVFSSMGDGMTFPIRLIRGDVEQGNSGFGISPTFSVVQASDDRNQLLHQT